jgi:hypothetical protein
MEKLNALGISMAGALAIAAAIATTAHAEITLLAEWLFDGTGFVGLLSTVIEGKLLIGDDAMNAKLSANCEVIVVGNVTGGDGVDSTKEVLTLEGVLVTEEKPLLGAAPDDCDKDSASECIDDQELEVFPLNLPWKTLAFLMEAGGFLDAAFGVKWEIRCLHVFFGTLDEDTCEWPLVDFELLSLALGNMELMGLGLPLGACSFTHEEFGDIEFEPGNILKDTAGGSLTISSGG